MKTYEQCVKEHDIKWWQKLAQDMCVAMGNSTDYVAVCLEEWVEKMWDCEEEEKGKKLVESISKRLNEVHPIEWSEIENGKSIN